MPAHQLVPQQPELSDTEFARRAGGGKDTDSVRLKNDTAVFHSIIGVPENGGRSLMLGRGTRRGEKYSDKSHFVIFDCFDGTLLKYFRQSTAMTMDER